MDPNERQQLKEALELSRENNAILKKMWRATQWGRAIKALYWIVIIAVTIGSLYFLQPYLDTLQGVYGGVQDAQAQFKDLF
jgi:hypothetical protein